MTQAATIRDAIVSRVKALQVGTAPKVAPRFKHVQDDPLPQLQPDTFPAAAVFILSEEMSPDGDGNEGPIKFVSDATIAISIARGGGTVKDLSGKVDDDADVILAALFEDPEFTQFGDDALFESVERIERRRIFPQEGEAYFGELRLAITFRSRVEYAPRLVNDYEGSTVEVRPLTHPNADKIVARWDVPAED